MDYERFTPGEAGWRVSKTKFTDLTTHLEQLGVSPMCPDLSEVTQKGEEQLDGVKVTVYTAGDIDGVEKEDLEDLPSSFKGMKHASKHKYWVNERGLLVQHWKDLIYVCAGWRGQHNDALHVHREILQRRRGQHNHGAQCGVVTRAACSVSIAVESTLPGGTP